MAAHQVYCSAASEYRLSDRDGSVWLELALKHSWFLVCSVSWTFDASILSSLELVTLRQRRAAVVANS